MKSLYEFEISNLTGHLPEPVELTDEDIKNIKNLDWKKIKVDDGDVTDAGLSYIIEIEFDLGKKLNKILPGIVFNIEQRKKTELNQPHIILTENLQRLGLGSKLYQAVLEEFGHLVSFKNKRHAEEEIRGLYKKISKTGKINMIDRNKNYLLVHQDNPEYQNIVDTFNIVS